MRKLAFLCLVFLGINRLSAQVLSPEVLNATGQTVSQKTMQISWSVGETNIATLNIPKLILTQGFLQPQIRTHNSDIEIIPVSDNINVFPNPVHDKLSIENNGINNIQSVFVYNALGQMVMEKNSDISTLDFSLLEAGMYYVNLSSIDHAEMHTFKIIKY